METYAYHLAEYGIIIDVTTQGPPDFTITYDETDPRYPEMDMERIDETYLKAGGSFWIAWMDDQPVGDVFEGHIVLEGDSDENG